MKKNKTGAIFIYIIFLVTLAVTFAIVLLNNTSFLFNVNNFFDNETNLYSNIKNAARVSVKINNDLNNNGSGFIDNLSCPNSVTMSGTLSIGTFSTSLNKYDNELFCEGTYNNLGDTRIYFNDNYTDFDKATYIGIEVGVSGGIGNAKFYDGDNTLINFSASNYNSPDGIDDDMNDDNYSGKSGSNTYPNGLEDDDNSGRKNTFGYVNIEDGFKKIFWNTSKTSKVISENMNNSDTDKNVLIGNVSLGKLYLEVDRNFILRILKFDKNKYDDFQELIVLESLESTIGAGVGYIQNASGFLTLNPNITNDEYIFNFRDYDYALFIKSDLQGTLLYKIHGLDVSGKGIYLTPIDDSKPNVIKYVGNEIIIDDKGVLLKKEAEIIFNK